ncbi:MAG: hypothetical protein HYX27_01130 [Acidobacteria bacterium]|nr:hypothetical protein [Acidobacteriota bacterium]
MSAALQERDPLLHLFEFPLEELYFPYGFPLRIRTNDVRVLHAAQEGLGNFLQHERAAPLRLDVAIVGEETGQFPPAPVVRSQDHLIWFVSDGHHFAACDFHTGTGIAWLTPKVFSDTALLRFHFLESASFCLVAERHLTGIHAACLAWKGHGILLCGEAGHGKSCLAYTLAKRGWTYVSDDASFLIRRASDSVIAGNPDRIRFRPAARDLFPELAGLVPVETPNGKMTIEVKTADLHLPSTADRIAVHSVIFLDRRETGGARLSPVPVSEALQRLAATNHYGRPATQAECVQSLRRVLSGAVLTLTFSDTGEAAACLEEFAG